MNKLTVPFKKRVYTFYFPEKWDECTYQQLAALVPRLQSWKALFTKFQAAKGAEKQALDIELQEARSQALIILIGIKPWQFWRKRALFSMYADEVADCLLATNFLFTKMDRSLPPLPYFKYKGVMYFGPTKGFSTLTGSGFHFSAEALKKGNLPMLLAIHYRPRGTENKHDPKHHAFCGDIRADFNRERLELDAAHFKKIDKKLLSAFAFVWHCYRLRLSESNPHIFNSSAETKAADRGWIPIFRALSDKPINFEQAAKMRMGRILMELGYRQEEVAAQKRSLKKK